MALLAREETAGYARGDLKWYKSEYVIKKVITLDALNN
jgi:hypothetical protein